MLLRSACFQFLNGDKLARVSDKMEIKTTTAASPSSDAGGGGNFSAFTIVNILSDRMNDKNCFKVTGESDII